MNEYGIILIGWLIAVFAFKIPRFYKAERNPFACVLGALTQLLLMIYLVFNI